MKSGKTLFVMMILSITNLCLFAQTAEEWKNLGNIELDSANYIKAIEYYQQALEVDSNYFDAYYNLGGAYFYLSDYDKSIEYFSKAITKNDTLATTYFSMGNVYLNKQEYDKAIGYFKEGIRLKPDSPEELCVLGSMYGAEKDNYIYATMYFKKAARLGDIWAQNYLMDNNIPWEDNFLKPDYNQIKQLVEDPQSDFYYPKLWDKFQRGDSLMTMDEKHHLYYGYVFNEKYSPYNPGIHDKQIYQLLDKEQPTNEEWEELVRLVNQSLDMNPFNCRFLYYQSLAYDALNKPEEAERNIRKTQCLLDALYTTGDGLSKETAIHVTGVPSEYDYLFMYNLSSESQHLDTGGFDVITLKENDLGLEELWFDVVFPLTNMQKRLEGGR